MNDYFINKPDMNYFKDETTTTSKKLDIKNAEPFLEFDESRYKISTVKQTKHRYVIQPDKK